ncbi:MAG TPA: DUF928 domain-containing protein [Chthoniobacteraceae bacterium]|jgi:hypothetical protein|nr:DUF928 domain-containing protein [Chthoniobacteraceae bacterium]
MKFPLASSLLWVCALCIAPPLFAAEPAEAPAAATPPVKKLAPIKYKPPMLAAEKIGERISGGTRGGTDAAGGKLPSIDVLTPDHVALTSQAQPTLFWYQSAPSKAGFEITLTEPDKAKPLVKVDLATAENAGIRALSLARQKVELQPGVTYRWNIALVVDKANRSKDVIAGGKIKRVAAPAGLEAKLAGAPPAERANLYAEAGLWYDALQAISTAIAADPGSAELHQRRAALLKEVGLGEPAAADQRPARD